MGKAIIILFLSVTALVIVEGVAFSPVAFFMFLLAGLTGLAWFIDYIVKKNGEVLC